MSDDIKAVKTFSNVEHSFYDMDGTFLGACPEDYSNQTKMVEGFLRNREKVELRRYKNRKLINRIIITNG